MPTDSDRRRLSDDDESVFPSSFPSGGLGDALVNLARRQHLSAMLSPYGAPDVGLRAATPLAVPRVDPNTPIIVGKAASHEAVNGTADVLSAIAGLGEAQRLARLPYYEAYRDYPTYGKARKDDIVRQIHLDRALGQSTRDELVWKIKNRRNGTPPESFEEFAGRPPSETTAARWANDLRASNKNLELSEEERKNPMVPAAEAVGRMAPAAVGAAGGFLVAGPPGAAAGWTLADATREAGKALEEARLQGLPEAMAAEYASRVFGANVAIGLAPVGRAMKPVVRVGSAEVERLFPQVPRALAGKAVEKVASTPLDKGIDTLKDYADDRLAQAYGISRAADTRNEPSPENGETAPSPVMPGGGGTDRAVPSDPPPVPQAPPAPDDDADDTAPAPDDTEDDDESDAPQDDDAAPDAGVFDPETQAMRRGGRAPGASEYVPAPGGGFAFGGIPPEVARATGLRPVPIRLRWGNGNFGLRGIAASRGKGLRANERGVAGVIADVARHFNEVWLTHSGGVVLAARDGANRLSIIRLRREPDARGHWYGVADAYRPSAIGGTLLWRKPTRARCLR